MMQSRRDHLRTWAGAVGTLSLASQASRLSAQGPSEEAPLPFNTKTLASLRAAAGIPAMAAASSFSGGRPVLLADGLRSMDAPVRVLAKDLWHIGSNTKSMTSTLVARLCEQRTISWDTTVADVFGSSVPKMHDSYKRATFRHLCSHHAGFKGGVSDRGMGVWSPDQLRAERHQYVLALLQEQPIGMPGEKMVYSNPGYIVAAAMLEKVHGAPWEELIARHLFRPLGLRSAGFGPPGTVGKLDQPLGHSRPSDTPLLVPTKLGDPARPSELAGVNAPAGLIHINLVDWIAYLNVHLIRPPSFLRPESWDILHKPPFTGDYAMGWVLRPGQQIWHNGSNGHWYAEMAVDRRRNSVACVASNSGDRRKAAPAVRALLKSALAARA